MLDVVISLGPLILGVILVAACIRAIANSDGRCHMEGCEDCFYSGWCEEQKRKDNGRRETDGCDFNQHG